MNISHTTSSWTIILSGEKAYPGHLLCCSAFSLLTSYCTSCTTCHVNRSQLVVHNHLPIEHSLTVIPQYQASCHCSSIRYTVTLSSPLSDPSTIVHECNCSICARNGYLQVYVQNECLEWETIPGLEDETCLQRYRFGRGRIEHYFCRKCGSSLMARSVEPGFYEGVVAVNVSSDVAFHPFFG